MRRSPALESRLRTVGATALLSGSVLLIGVGVQALRSAAYADSSSYEVFCSSTPLGNIVLNDVVTTGTLSPSAPAPGQQFSVAGFQVQEQLPASLLQGVEAAGITTLAGTFNTMVGVSGATPASISTGAMSFAVPVPKPIPTGGLTLHIPSQPMTIGPFTATSSNIAVQADPASVTTIEAGGIGPLNLSCGLYPNNELPAGFTNQIPPGLPVPQVIATAGNPTITPPSALTGPYELYCPHTPVGDLAFNDVTTSATISPGNLSAGQQFQVSGYQIQIPLPPGVVTAAAGLNNTSFDGLAASAVDAYGATPDQVSTGSMAFDVPIPNPVPNAPLGLSVPSAPTTVGPFTAAGGPITIAEDQSVHVVAALSGKAFNMSCTAYPNDSVASSGSASTAPTSSPIRPVIAFGSASGTSGTTTTTGNPIGPGGPTTSPPGTPYELYCPSSPVGNLVLNDTVTTGTITPSSLSQGDQFSLSNLQTQFSIPQSVAQQAENLGLTQLSGDMGLFVNARGAQGTGYGVGVAVGGGSTGTFTASTGGGVTAITSPPATGPALPYPGPFGFGLLDMAFNVTLPSPVPAGGVQFVATPPPVAAGANLFVASGGPIQLAIGGVNLNATEFGDNFGLFCTTYPNDSEPTGLSIDQPEVAPIQPIIATGQAVIPPPVQGGKGPYELYCPATPVGNIVLNDVSTTGTLTPADPTAGEQFNITGYENQVTLPSAIVSAAAALGNTAITGTATATIDATGATPSQLPSGTLNINTPIPEPIPVGGLTLLLPGSPTTVGPFTASGGPIILSQDAHVQLTLVVSGSDLNLTCTAYPNNSAPTGITTTGPTSAPVSPVIATVGTSASPTVAVSPSTGLSAGQSVSVTGSGFAPNQIGNVLECNNASGEPTVALGAPVNTSVPVGCTAPSYNDVNTSASGTFSTTYAVGTGTIGPPCGGANDVFPTCPTTDSAGQNPANDAANYPCPPTPAQEAAGATCSLLYGDLDLQTATTPILFVGESPPPSTQQPTTAPQAPTSGTTTTTSPTVAPVTASSSAADSSATTAAGAVAASSSGSNSATPTNSASAPTAAATSDSAQTGAASDAVPVVQASSGSLAFTGVGSTMRWMLLVAGGLIFLGLAMLVATDTPRRLLSGASHLRADPRTSRAEREMRARSARQTLWHEVLWIDGSGIDRAGERR